MYLHTRAMEKTRSFGGLRQNSPRLQMLQVCPSKKTKDKLVQLGQCVQTAFQIVLTNPTLSFTIALSPIPEASITVHVDVDVASLYYHLRLWPALLLHIRTDLRRSLMLYPIPTFLHPFLHAISYYYGLSSSALYFVRMNALQAPSVGLEERWVVSSVPSRD